MGAILGGLAAICALVFFLVNQDGGGGSVRSLFRKSPGDVVRAFYLAANDGKYSECEAMLSKEARDAVSSRGGRMAGNFKHICDMNTRNGNILAVELVSEVIRGEGATVAVKIRFKDGTVKMDEDNQLILRDGQWQLTIGQSPGDVVRAFYLAANDGKYSECEALLSKEARDSISGPLGQMAGGLKGICDKNTKNGNIQAVELVSEVIRGEGATVAVKIRFKDGTVKMDEDNPLILHDGKWQLTIGH